MMDDGCELVCSVWEMRNEVTQARTQATYRANAPGRKGRNKLASACHRHRHICHYRDYCSQCQHEHKSEG